MPIRRQAMQHTPFGEMIRGNLKRIASDTSSGLPEFTGAAVLLDMLGTCNIPDFYPRDTNMFGRTIPAEVARYVKAHELISAIAGPNPHGVTTSGQVLAESYINTAYRLAAGIRAQTGPKRVIVDGTVYFIHSLKGRGIGLFAQLEGEPINHNEQVVRISRRGIYPEAATMVVENVVRSADADVQRELVAGYGTRLQRFGVQMLTMCGAA